MGLPLLPSVLAACGLAAPLLALVADRPVPAPEGTALLRYGRRARVLANGALGLPFIVAALVAWRSPPLEDARRFWTLVTAAALALLFLWVLRIEVVGVRHAITAEALEGGSPWRRGPRLPWGEVAEVTFSAAGQEYVVRGRDGARVAVSRWLEGLPALAGALERHGIAVPPGLGGRARSGREAA